MTTVFVNNTNGPPQNSVNVGCECKKRGHEFMYTVLIQTPKHGPVGGKATKTDAWYTVDGKEHSAANFSWLNVTKGKIVLVRNDESHSNLKGRICFGRETGREHDLFAALAISEFGLIPGKAAADCCWYGYGGQEYNTGNFMWVLSVDE